MQKRTRLLSCFVGLLLLTGSYSPVFASNEDLYLDPRLTPQQDSQEQMKYALKNDPFMKKGSHTLSATDLRTIIEYADGSLRAQKSFELNREKTYADKQIPVEKTNEKWDLTQLVIESNQNGQVSYRANNRRIFTNPETKKLEVKQELLNYFNLTHLGSYVSKQAQLQWDVKNDSYRLTSAKPLSASDYAALTNFKGEIENPQLSYLVDYQFDKDLVLQSYTIKTMENNQEIAQEKTTFSKINQLKPIQLSNEVMALVHQKIEFTPTKQELFEALNGFAMSVSNLKSYMLSLSTSKEGNSNPISYSSICLKAKEPKFNTFINSNKLRYDKASFYVGANTSHSALYKDGKWQEYKSDNPLFSSDYQPDLKLLPEKIDSFKIILYPNDGYVSIESVQNLSCTDYYRTINVPITDQAKNQPNDSYSIAIFLNHLFLPFSVDAIENDLTYSQAFSDYNSNLIESHSIKLPKDIEKNYLKIMEK